MANTNVFTGADGSITIASPEETITVGRVQDVTVQVTSDVKAFHEIGQRYASELRPGNMEVTGTIGRAYINGALLTLLLGEAAGGPPAASWAQPEFDITLLLKNAATPDVANTVVLHGVKINAWNYTMPEDDFVMETVGFQALYLTVEDEG